MQLMQKKTHLRVSVQTVSQGDIEILVSDTVPGAMQLCPFAKGNEIPFSDNAMQLCFATETAEWLTSANSSCWGWMQPIHAIPHKYLRKPSLLTQTLLLVILDAFGKHCGSCSCRDYGNGRVWSLCLPSSSCPSSSPVNLTSTC